MIKLIIICVIKHNANIDKITFVGLQNVCKNIRIFFTHNAIFNQMFYLDLKILTPEQSVLYVGSKNFF